MTVQELIDQLLLIEDKSQPIYYLDEQRNQQLNIKYIESVYQDGDKAILIS